MCTNDIHGHENLAHFLRMHMVFFLNLGKLLVKDYAHDVMGRFCVRVVLVEFL
jgi:hypothetical protein